MQIKNWFFLIFLFPIVAVGQSRQIKIWRKDQPLTWSDFRGAIDTSSSLDAITSAGDTLFYRWHTVNKQIKLEFTSYSLMVQSRSWVRPTKKSDALLKHEQLHFNIAEFFNRKLLKELSNTTFSDNFENEIKSIVWKEMRERDEMQLLYDNETQHSKNLIQQKKWDEYINTLLN